MPTGPKAPRYLLTTHRVRRILDQAAARDRDVASALQAFGFPPERRQPPGFLAIVRIIVGQRISTKAAATVFERVTNALADPEDPACILHTSPTVLQQTGLTHSKVRCLHALAEAVHGGALDLAVLPRLEDAKVSAHLTTIKGIGPWTAQMYLLFCLGRLDVWPSTDLGVLNGLQYLKGLTKRPSPAESNPLADPFRPERSAIALLTWHLTHQPELLTWAKAHHKRRR